MRQLRSRQTKPQRGHVERRRGPRVRRGGVQCEKDGVGPLEPRMQVDEVNAGVHCTC